MLFLIVAAGLFIGWLIWHYNRPTPTDTAPVSTDYTHLLEEQVSYYRTLTEAKKKEFADRVGHFLAHIRIEGVDTPVDGIDKVLIASSAIIPIFGFEGWDYYRLTNVLLYADTFNADYETTGTGRTIMGMVGEGGALQSTMVLSKPALRAGFADENSKANTGIHEFVHLLDKADGAIDGLPDYMLDKNHVKPWLQLIHRSIDEIRANQSDIDPYAATNEAEFFAVVAEYFFKQPGLLQQKHPALFTQLETIFRQHPGTPDKTV